MIGALASRSLKRSGFSPSRDFVWCSFARHFTLSVLLSPSGAKLGIGELNAGGGKDILLVASCHRNRDKFLPDGHSACM